MRALAKAWHIGVFRDRGRRLAPESPPRPITSPPPERAQEHRGLTARELIRMAQAARIARD